MLCRLLTLIFFNEQLGDVHGGECQDRFRRSQYRIKIETLADLTCFLQLGPAFTHASYSDFRALRSILSIGDGPRRLTAEQIPYCKFDQGREG